MNRKFHRGLNRRRKISAGRMALLVLIFWAVSGFVMLTILNGGPVSSLEANGENVGKMYIGSIFPNVNRGDEVRQVSADAGETFTKENEQAGSELSKEKTGLLKTMVGSMFPVAAVLDDDLAEEDPGVVWENEQTKKVEEESKAPEVAKVIDYTNPVVIIYHTHATESYQPVTDGNFHSLEEYGTVREVGDVLTAELEAKGIQVIHDKTLHDSPSYNKSYGRSLETVNSLMGSNQSTKIIVDLHRDAASYTGNVGKTVSINKDTVAKYSLVIGTGNPNVEALRSFANKINSKAEELFPGFGGRIIEKQYKFNQYVSDYHLLLEVGNNQNTIEQAKMTGKYFADVLAETIKDID